MCTIAHADGAVASNLNQGPRYRNLDYFDVIYLFCLGIIAYVPHNVK